MIRQDGLIPVEGGDPCARCRRYTVDAFEVDGDEAGSWAYCPGCAEIVAAELEDGDRELGAIDADLAARIIGRRGQTTARYLSAVRVGR